MFLQRTEEVPDLTCETKTKTVGVKVIYFTLYSNMIKKEAEGGA